MRIIDLNLDFNEKNKDGKVLNPFFKLEIPVDIMF